MMPTRLEFLTGGVGLLLAGGAILAGVWYWEQVRNLNTPTLPEGGGFSVTGVLAILVGLALIIVGVVSAF